MENLSVVLWTKLWRYIGTEEVVFVRRRRCEIESKLASSYDELLEPILSGSKGEGFGLHDSDNDCVCVLRQISVLHTSSLETYNPDIIMETNDIKPGSARLRVVNMPNLKPFVDAVVWVGNEQYLSSLFFRDHFVKSFQIRDPEDYPHGPCVTSKLTQNTEIDIVPCFRCNEWPDVAEEWIYRRRVNNWPILDLIEDIVNDGCLLVPIGNRQSEHSFMEWRISFSVAERKLVYSFNHTQFLCYGLLKLYLKNVIESDKEIKDLDLLCSYFLKTCLFYCIEEECIVWDQRNLIQCFWICFSRLFSWIQCGYCPNYFVKENNMFEGKVFGLKQRKLVQHLSKRYELGNLTFTSIACLSDLHIVVGRGLSDYITEVVTTTERELFCDISMFVMCKGEIVVSSFKILSDTIKDIYFQMKETRNVADITILTITLFSKSCDLASHLYHYIRDRNISNKAQHRFQSMLKNYIIHSCTNHDICYGWLKYATFCYLTGQYSNVVHMTKYLLTKFSAFTIYYTDPGLRHNSKAYMSEICNRNLTFFQKMKCALALAFKCFLDCGLYPPEIDSVLRSHSFKGVVYIPPVVYSNVLMFLSYNELGLVELGNVALNDLAIAALDDIYFVYESERSLSIELLERCSQIRDNTRNR